MNMTHDSWVCSYNWKCNNGLTKCFPDLHPRSRWTFSCLMYLQLFDVPYIVITLKCDTAAIQSLRTISCIPYCKLLIVFSERRAHPAKQWPTDQPATSRDLVRWVCSTRRRWRYGIVDSRAEEAAWPTQPHTPSSQPTSISGRERTNKKPGDKYRYQYR